MASAVRDLGLPYQLVRDKRRPYGTVLAITVAFLAVIAQYNASGERFRRNLRLSYERNC